MTSAKFSGFWTPSPLVRIYSIEITQPPLISSELGQPPLPPSLLTSFVTGPLALRPCCTRTWHNRTKKAALFQISPRFCSFNHATVSRQTHIYHLIFTEPGKHTLAHPCIFKEDKKKAAKESGFRPISTEV